MATESGYPTLRERRGFAVRAAMILPSCILWSLNSWGQAFPGQGIDVFPTSARVSVTIGSTLYTAEGGFDPQTQATRSDAVGEGSGSDVGGAAVQTGVCTNCTTTVADAQLGCWPAPPPAWEGSPNSREVHTEMLSLSLCGPCTQGGCTEICYLAGQPAFEALAAVSAAAFYTNSYGEVERLNPGTDTNDFPAASFWDIKGVVRITPPPPGTSGVFVLNDLTDSILMVNRNITTLPPSIGTAYEPEEGTRQPDGGGGSCGVLPIAIRDPVSNAVGQINETVCHNFTEPGRVYNEDFATGVGTFTIANGANSSAGWAANNNCPESLLPGHTAPEVLRWGTHTPLNCNNYGSTGHIDSAQTPVLDLPVICRLNFNYFLDYQEPVSFENADVQVRSSGATLLSLANGQLQSANAWLPANVPVGPGAVSVQFIGQTADGINNIGAGWLIDDVNIDCPSADGTPACPSADGAPATSGWGALVLMMGISLAMALALFRLRRQSVRG